MERWTYQYNDCEQIDYLLVSRPLKRGWTMQAWNAHLAVAIAPASHQGSRGNPRLFRFCAIIDVHGTWRSPVAHLNGVQGVVGSNPTVPTQTSGFWPLFFSPGRWGLVVATRLRLVASVPNPTVPMTQTVAVSVAV